MLYQIEYMGDKKEDAVSTNLPGCTRPGDVIRLGKNLYKILSINRKEVPYVKVSFHKAVEKGPRRQTRR